MFKIIFKFRFLFIFLIVVIVAISLFIRINWYRSRAADNERQIALGQDLYLNLDTDLPDGQNDVKFFVMKKTPDKVINNRPQKFGVSGAQAEWDVLPSEVARYNVQWGSNKTGEEMLDKHFAMLSALGISWVRYDMVWQRTEPTQGTYDWQYTDKMFEASRKYKLNMLASIFYTPDWNWKRTCKNQSAEYTNSPLDLGSSGSRSFNAYMTNLVNRYKPGGTYYTDHNITDTNYGIRNWQVWNEQELSFWTNCQTGIRGRTSNPIFDPQYASLLKSAYAAIKSADPQAKVLTGGLSHIDPTRMLTNLYTDLAADKNFDIIDMHTYEDVNAFAGKIAAFAGVRNAHGDGSKEIWLSETSSANKPSDPQDPGQTNYMKSIFEKFESLSPSLNLGKAFWWTTREYWFPPNESKEMPDNALFENNFYPRKIYFDLGEWLGTIKKKGEVPALVVNKGKITAVISKMILNEVGDYEIFYASPTKMVTALPFKLEVRDPSIPDCSNLTGPNKITLGQSGTYSATFSSLQGNLKGEIDAGQNGSPNLIWYPGTKKIAGTTGTLSYVWTPTKVGTFDLFCRAWNDSIAECRGNSRYVDGPPRYNCNSQTSSMTVTVDPGSSTVPPVETLTIIPTKSPIPSVTPTPISCNPDNLLQNGCFEAGIRGWEDPILADGLVTIVTDVFHSGNKSMRLKFSGYLRKSQWVTSQGSTTYTLSAWGKKSGNASTVVRVDEYYFDGVNYNFKVSHQLNFTLNTWEYKTISFTTASQTNRIPVTAQLEGDNKSQATIFYVDDINLVPGSQSFASPVIN